MRTQLLDDLTAREGAPPQMLVVCCREIMWGIGINAHVDRWLEDPESSETKAFVLSQNEVSEKFLDTPVRWQALSALTKFQDYPKWVKVPCATARRAHSAGIPWEAEKQKALRAFWPFFLRVIIKREFVFCGFLQTAHPSSA